MDNICISLVKWNIKEKEKNSTIILSVLNDLIDEPVRTNMISNWCNHPRQIENWTIHSLESFINEFTSQCPL